MKIEIPYGTKTVAATVPRDRILGIIGGRSRQKRSVRALLARSLRWPLGVSLEDVARGARTALIVIPDSTRKSHVRHILPVIVRLLYKKGVSADVLVASGLHRKETRPQLERMVGTRIMRTCRVRCHEQHAGAFVRLGTVRRGIPIVINKKITQYDRVISIGVIEPHLYAGYSGGAKTVAVGLAGEPFINATHHPRFLDHPGTRIGRIEGNTFQHVLWQVVRRVTFDFAINVVNDQAGNPCMVYAGSPRAVFLKGVARARAVFERTVPHKASVVICGVGHPKDANLYQASRAINYILNVDRPILAKGGLLIVVARMEEGPGLGEVEKRCYRALLSMGSPRRFVEKVRSRGCRAGLHRAYMIARALVNSRVAFVGERAPDMLRATPLIAFTTLPEAVAYAMQTMPKGSGIYVVPHALSTIARFDRATRRYL